MTNLYVVNHSTSVSNGDVQLMTRACAHQLRYDAAPIFGLAPIPVTYISAKNLHSVAAPGSWVISILDDSDQADALGWHTEEQGDLIYGRVFAKPVLDNGGDALTNALSVASVLSHEVLETFADPRCNLWADDGRGVLTAYEICDPVESDSYPLSVSGAPVPISMSNFATPSWCDPNAAKGGKFDFMGNVSEPFEMTRGGYVIEMVNGQVSQQFGDRYPDWRKETKKVDTARGARR
jgi:hypothetical protein